MREFSRVDANIPLSVRLVTEEEKPNIRARISGDLTIISPTPYEEPSDKTLAEWLKCINSKLDFLINLLSIKQEGFSSLPVKHVNIGGGGISFFSDTSFNIGDVIELKTVLELLYPVAMYLYGKVLSCEKIDGEYKVAVEFINIDEDIRDYIVRFVFHRQRQIIRQQKEI